MPVKNLGNMFVFGVRDTKKWVDSESGTAGVVAEGVFKAWCVEKIWPSITMRQLASRFLFFRHLALPNHTGSVSAGFGLLKLTISCPSMARVFADEAEIYPAFCGGSDRWLHLALTM